MTLAGSILACVLLAQAQPVAARAVIEGPSVTPPGVLVTLNGAGSTGTGFAWAVIPEAPDNIAVDTSGKQLYFATPVQPGTWTVVLAVASGDTVDLATHQLVVGAPAPLQLSLPEKIPEGQSATGVVRATGPVEVQLHSDSPSRLQVPPVVQVPFDKATFTLTAPDNQETDGDTTVRVTAEAGGDRVTTRLLVVDNDLPPPDQLWGIVIHESSQPSPEKAIVLSSKRIRDALNGRWRIADKDVQDQHGEIPPDLKPWVERAPEDRLPWLFMVDSQGRIYHQGPLPLDVDRVLDLIHSLLPGSEPWSTKNKSKQTCPLGSGCTQP